MKKKLLKMLVNTDTFQRLHRKYSNMSIVQNTLTPDILHQNVMQTDLLDRILLYQKAMILLKDDIFTIRFEDQLIKFYLPDALTDKIQTQIFRTNAFYENDLLLEVRRYIKPDSYILDAGTNIANHTLFFSKICNAKKIYCFEPLKTAFKIIEKNLELNNISNVEKYNLALGEATTKAVISNFYEDNLGGTGFSFTSGGDYDVVPLDSMNIEKLDFCKVDVEGCQLEFLKGAKNTLLKFKPVLWIEMLNEFFRGYDAEREVILPQKLLNEYGYVLVKKMSNLDYLYEHRDNPISDRSMVQKEMTKL